MAKKDQAKAAKKRTRPAPAPKPETIEEHMRRLGCFSPGEVAALLKAKLSHEHLDQLGRDKGVGLPLPAEVEAQAQSIIDQGKAEPAPSRSEGVGENEGGEGTQYIPAGPIEEGTPETPAP